MRVEKEKRLDVVFQLRITKDMHEQMNKLKDEQCFNWLVFVRNSIAAKLAEQNKKGGKK